MANRSYLYSSNKIPSEVNENMMVVGLSEWGGKIPLVYKILLSASPKICKSMIFESVGSVAIYSNYDDGIKKLEDFFSLYAEFDINREFKKSLEFLSDRDNKNEYFVLEVGEVLEFDGEDLDKYHQIVLNDVIHYEDDIKEFAERINGIGKAKAQFPFLFEGFETNVHLAGAINSIGTTNWSNVLCFDPFPVKKPEEKIDYLTCKRIDFELVTDSVFPWILKIVIDLDSNEVILTNYEYVQYVIPLIDAYYSYNDDPIFQFNMASLERIEYTIHFSLFKSRLEKIPGIFKMSQ